MNTAGEAGETVLEDRTKWRYFKLPMGGPYALMPPDDERGWEVLNDVFEVTSEASAQTACRVLNALESRLARAEALTGLAKEALRDIEDFMHRNYAWGNRGLVLATEALKVLGVKTYAAERLDALAGGDAPGSEGEKDV